MKNTNDNIEKLIRENPNSLKLILLFVSKLNTSIPIQLTGKWILKKDLMRFLNYGETTMREIEKEYGLVMTKLKGQKFYDVPFILTLLEKNQYTLK